LLLLLLLLLLFLSGPSRMVLEKPVGCDTNQCGYQEDPDKWRPVMEEHKPDPDALGVVYNESDQHHYQNAGDDLAPSNPVNEPPEVLG
jgi:hypothetical protein